MRDKEIKQIKELDEQICSLLAQRKKIFDVLELQYVNMNEYEKIFLNKIDHHYHIYTANYLKKIYKIIIDRTYKSNFY